MEDYIDAFQSFVNQIKKKAVICGDDPYLPTLSYTVPVVRYGLNEGNDYQARNVSQGPDGIEYDVFFHGALLHHVKLPGNRLSVFDQLAGRVRFGAYAWYGA